MNNLNLTSYLENTKCVKIYLCGPTVYDDVHIGNIAPVIIFDFIIRYLKYHNKEFIYVHNITDIDDKIIQKAKQENKKELEISNYYFEEYKKILNKLNIATPNFMPKVSSHIQDIQDTISKLMEQGYAEINEKNDVVFLINKISEYGEISNQKLNQLNQMSDFCLWKSSKEGIIWDSPWGKGRPGWHTECFSFILKIFGETIDIHGGGIDLKFPHHENENAHCRAIFKKPLAKKWIHVGHVMSEEEKISKSSGKRNYIVKDLLDKYSANTIRLIFLNTKYSAPLKISQEFLNKTKEEWKKIEHIINKSRTYLYISNNLENNDTNQKLNEEFLGYISEDLNLPEALTWIQQIRKKLNSAIKTTNYSEIKKFHSLLVNHLNFLGFQIQNIHTSENINLILTWNKLIQQKQYKEADEVREILIKKTLI